jgi:cytosine deaminase
MQETKQYWLTNVRLSDGSSVDIEVANGRFGSIGAAPSDVAVVDGRGRLCLPALIEGHVHLDKTFLGCPWYSFAGGKTVPDRIREEKLVRRSLNVPVEERGALLVEREIAAGAGYLRTHVDVDADWKLANLEAVLKIRERYRDAIDIEIVAFPQSGIVSSPSTAELLEAAMSAGADLIGGLDPASIDGDPVRHLDIVFGIADRHGKAVDIHLHEGGELGLFTLGLIAERTKALGLQRRVTVSHAYCLADASDAELGRTAAQLADGGISILSSAPEVRMPPVRNLREEGVTVFLGSDNVRDAWSPFGNGDMLERAAIAARQQVLVEDNELALAFDLVTTAAAEATGRTDYGIAPGRQADFLLIDAVNLAEAVATHPLVRETYKRGRKVGQGAVVVPARKDHSTAPVEASNK